MNNSTWSIGEPDDNSLYNPSRSHQAQNQQKIDPRHQSIRDTVIWTNINKYFFSIALIMVSATVQFDFIGFAYFFLFVFHSFAYYSFRSNLDYINFILACDEPIDVLINIRGNKKNLRSTFKFLLIVFSVMALSLILIGKGMKEIYTNISNSLQDEDESYLLVQTMASYYLVFIRIMIPTFDTVFTLCQSLFVLLLALMHALLYEFEIEESQGRTMLAQKAVEPIQNIDRMKNHHIQKAVQLIKDFKFKSNSTIILEMIVLAFISSGACSILVFPYQLYFLILCLVNAITGSLNSLSRVSKKFNLVFLAILLVDLPTEYIVKSGQFFQNVTQTEDYFLEVFGFISGIPNYVEFYLKVTLLLIQCQKIKYSYDYLSVLTQIKTQHQDKPELNRIFRKTTSLTQRIFEPISIFVFNFLALMFAFMHPSIILFALVPFFIYGFFMNQKEFQTPSKIFQIIISIYLVSYTIFNLYFLLATDSYDKEYTVTFWEKILGAKRDPTVYTKLFPQKFDYFFFFVMSFFVHYINRKKLLIQRLEQSFGGAQGAAEDLQNKSDDEDNWTLQEDVSEIISRSDFRSDDRSEISRSRQSRQTNRLEEQKAESDDEIDIPNSLQPPQLRQSKQSKDINSKAFTSIARDETLRGKIRRFFINLYARIKSFLDQLFELVIIHFSKISLMALFMISALKANMFNAVFFCFFLVLCLTSYENIQRYWKLPIFFNSLVLIFMYAIDVFQPTAITSLDSSMLTFIGLSFNSIGHINFWVYSPYIFLLTVLVITYYIIHTKKYEEYLKTYQLLETSEKRIDKYTKMKLDEQKKQLSQADPITRLIIKYSLYLLMVALFMECALLPISILNIVLLILLSIIVVTYLTNQTLIDVYSRLHAVIWILKWISTIFIFMKYMFQFEDYTTKISISSTEESIEYDEKLPLLYTLLGIENSMVPLKLFCLAVVVTISNNQLKFLQYAYLLEILREEDEDWNRLYFEKPTNFKSKFKHVWHNIYVYTLYIVYHLLLPMPILFFIMFTKIYSSLVGCGLLVLTLIIMWRQRLTQWKYSYKVIGIVTMIMMLVNYTVQFVFLVIPGYTSFIEWLGILSSSLEDSTVYDQLIPLFVVMVVCVLQKESLKSEQLFRTTVNAELVELEERENQAAQEEHESQDEDDDSRSFEDKKGDLTNKNYENAKMYGETPGGGDDMTAFYDSHQIKLVYIFEAPIRNCLQIKNDMVKVFFFKFGMIILYFFALINMLTKLNVTSIILAVIICIILKTNYFPKCFQESLDQQVKRERVAKIIVFTIIYLSTLIIFEYFMDIDSPSAFSFTAWKSFVATKLCYSSSDDCKTDWQTWLSLSNVKSGYTYLDFFVLLICYLNYFFLTQTIKIEEDLIHPEPQMYDKNDFLYHDYKKHKLKAYFLQFAFKWFPYVFLGYIFIFAATFHGSDTSDLIKLVYLSMGLFYFINFRKLFTKNSIYLRYLRIYNLIVLFMMLTYQAPAFICPAVTSSSSISYIAKQQCQYYLTTDMSSISSATTNNILAIYIVVVESIGLEKIYSVEFSYILMFILTELQYYIFKHPFYQVYLLEHLKEEKETDGKLRAFMFVERSHLTRLWSYKAIKEEIKILHQRLMRLTKTLRSDEHARELLLVDDQDENLINENTLMLDQFSSEQNSAKADNSVDDARNAGIGEDREISHQQEQTEDNYSEGTKAKLEREEKLNQLIDQYSVHLERIALQLLQNEESPVVPLKLYKASFRKYILNHANFDVLDNEGDSLMREQAIEQYLIEIVMDIQKQVHMKNRIDLYNQEGIGLNFAIQQGSDLYLKESEYTFFNHLILNKTPASSLLDDTKLQKEADRKFEVQNDYEDFFEIKDQLKDIEKDSTPFLKKLDYYTRTYLWTNLVNKLLLYSLTQENKKRIDIQKISYFRLIGYAILSQSQFICYIAFFYNFIANADLISLVLPMSALFYALLDSPFPNVRYWKFVMIYILIVIVLKFFYQLPIFCGTPAYTIYSIDQCIYTTFSSETLLKRIDYVIGIHKFSGTSSYPKDEGILRGITQDLLVMLALLLHKNYLIAVGVWHYIRPKNNIYQNPSFKCKASELTENERLHQIRKENYKLYVYDQSNIFGKIWINMKIAVRHFFYFGLKILPVYMNKKVKNIDMRTQQEQPYVTHNIKKVKPGKDCFNLNFYSLLLLLFFNLLFYSNYTTDSQHAAALSSINFQRFQIPQVILLFFLLMLMMIERMLFRHRSLQNLQPNSKASWFSPLTIKFGIFITLVVVIHLWLGFVLPRRTSYFFFENKWIVVSYILWLLYFIASAIQIRHGYPQGPYRQPFQRQDTSILSVNTFRVYRAIPLLWEMKVITDWTVTRTCLDLFQWFKLDDAFNYLYYTTYMNANRADRYEFANRPWYEKFFQGFCFTFLLILVIILPILLFSGFTPLLSSNPVYSASLDISLELSGNNNSYTILSTQAYSIQYLSDSDVSELNSMFVPSSVYYDTTNMQKLYFSPYSDYEWSISPPSAQKFVSDYNSLEDSDSDSTITIKSSWSFTRDQPSGYETTYIDVTSDLSLSEAADFISVLAERGNTSVSTDNGTMVVSSLFPKILELGSSSSASVIDVTASGSNNIYSSTNLTINLLSSTYLYWTYEIADEDQNGIYSVSSDDNTDYIDGSMVVVVYNDEVITSKLSSYNISVIGLYTTIVIAIGSFIRLIFDRISQRVIYEEMADTEKVFEICEGIFIAQLEGDLIKEKKFYDLLIRMYRSPETLIKITGTKLKYRDKEELGKSQ